MRRVPGGRSAGHAVDGGWQYQPSGINSDGVMVGHDGSWPDEWAYRWTP